MKKVYIEFAFFFAFVLTVVLSVVSFENNCVNIRSSVLRLHVVANSDSDKDQELKLKVRDAVVEYCDFLSDSKDKISAEKKAKQHKKEIEDVASGVIKENGYDYSVKVEIGKSVFPTKTYDNITLPAGTYDAVKILIGNASGKNWWCVMFPSLCLPAASNSTKLEDILNEEELHLVKSNPKYEIRFWIIEKIENMKKRRL